MIMNAITVSHSRPARPAPLQKLAGTVIPSVSKWCRKAIPRWTKRGQPEECDKGVDVDMGNKNLKWFLGNEGGVVVEDEWDEWDEKAMLDIAEVVAEVVEELDVYKGTWKEWNEADIIIDSAKFDEANSYSDDSVNFDSCDGDEGKAPEVDKEERARLCWHLDDFENSNLSEAKTSDDAEDTKSEYSSTWDSVSEGTTDGEVFIPSVVEEVNIFEGLFDEFDKPDVSAEHSAEIVQGSFYSYHSSDWDSSWDSEDGATGGGRSFDLDWLYPVIGQIYDLYAEI